MDKKILFILFLSVSVAGCAAHHKAGPNLESVQDSSVQESKTPVEAKKAQPKTASLWQENQTSLFTAKKANRLGDILTVAIFEKASAEKEAETATGRSSSASLGIPKLLGYEAALAAKNPNLDPSKLLSASSENDFQGSGSTSREETLSATLTTQVVQVLPNNNLRIQGSKTVRVNSENQFIRLTGIVRPEDITARNMIDSKYILDARIEYSGKGVISEKQRPGWLIRLVDTVWPF